jgi:hypothetical protein
MCGSILTALDGRRMNGLRYLYQVLYIDGTCGAEMMALM